MEILETTSRKQMGNLKEMEKLLERYKWPKLTQEETEYVSWPIMSQEQVKEVKEQAKGLV